MTNKADATYWNETYRNVGPRMASLSDMVRAWLVRHIPPAETGRDSCIEVGCYPGRYLSSFGPRGYELFGVDLAQRLPELSAWLGCQGYRVGRFWQEDFMSFDPGRRFDVVISVGFIEHFTNWEEVLRKHVALVAPGGVLAAVVPNFIGTFQRWFHGTFDRENLSRHHLEAMEIDTWTPVVEEAGLRVVTRGYFGRFDFWTDPEPRSRLRTFALRTLYFLRPCLRAVLPQGRRMYAPYGGLIARRGPQ